MRGLVLAMALALTPALAAAAQVVVAEAGDAGELRASAQIINGAVSQIDGTLINLGTGGNIDDLDLYRLTITDPAAFSVTVTSKLSVDDDAQLFLFNSAGVLVGHDDDGGLGSIPQFNAGTFAGLAAGNYFLAYDLFNTQPRFTLGALTSWSREPDPFQAGPYSLFITGVEGVPEPASWALLIAGLGLTGAALRRRRAALALA